MMSTLMRIGLLAEERLLAVPPGDVVDDPSGVRIHVEITPQACVGASCGGDGGGGTGGGIGQLPVTGGSFSEMLLWLGVALVVVGAGFVAARLLRRRRGVTPPR